MESRVGIAGQSKFYQSGPYPVKKMAKKRRIEITIESHTFTREYRQANGADPAKSPTLAPNIDIQLLANTILRSDALPTSTKDSSDDERTGDD
jgi:hypothetical protein